jgi:hypothetical protein
MHGVCQVAEVRELTLNYSTAMSCTMLQLVVTDEQGAKETRGNRNFIRFPARVFLFISVKSPFGTTGPKTQSGPPHVAGDVFDPVPPAIGTRQRHVPHQRDNQPALQMQCTECHSECPFTRSLSAYPLVTRSTINPQRSSKIETPDGPPPENPHAPH